MTGPAILHYLTPILLVYVLFGAPGGFLTRLVYLCVWLFANVIYNFVYRMNVSSSKRVLESVPISHFVEKVRWALDKIGMPYTEEGEVVVMGILFKGRTVPTLHVGGRTRLGDSKQILEFLYGEDPDNRGFLKVEDKDKDLLKRLDRDYAPALRKWLYHHVIPHKELCIKIWGKRIPEWQAALLPYGLYQLVVFLIRYLLKLNAQTAQKSMEVVYDFKKEIEETLKDGRKYWNNKELTLMDIALCSYTGVAVCAPEYGGTGLTFEEVPESVLDKITEIRESVLGQYVLRLYKYVNFFRFP